MCYQISCQCIYPKCVVAVSGYEGRMTGSDVGTITRGCDGCCSNAVEEITVCDEVVAVGVGVVNVGEVMNVRKGENYILISQTRVWIETGIGGNSM